jgi:hypothetical protein
MLAGDLGCECAAFGAVLVITRKAYMDDGRPLELTRSVFRGDRYSAIVHSVRKNKSILQATSS